MALEDVLNLRWIGLRSIASEQGGQCQLLQKAIRDFSNDLNQTFCSDELVFYSTSKDAVASAFACAKIEARDQLFADGRSDLAREIQRVNYAWLCRQSQRLDIISAPHSGGFVITGHSRTRHRARLMKRKSKMSTKTEINNG
jgi:hypothetical protein